GQALLGRFQRALEGRPELIRLLHPLAPSVAGFTQLVVPDAAERGALIRLVPLPHALLVANVSPPAVVHDADDHPELVARRRVELDEREAEGPVAREPA